MSRKYFGTDGIRGQVGERPITAEFMLKLGWAAGHVFARGGQSDILIGKDTRISGYMFESALEAGLISAGVNVGLIGPMPTPAIAYLTQTFRAQAGIVISASHNPYQDNGIKFFSTHGTKLPDEIELEIESLLDKDMTTAPSHALGKASRVPDAAGRYIEFCKSTVPHNLRLNGMKIVLDCAHGATYHVAPSVFKELGAKIETIGCSPNGLNINEGVGSTRPEALQTRVRELGYDLGIAFDGDGDRVMMVDHTGALVDGDELVYVIASERKSAGKLDGGVVGTLMTNLGMALALEAQSIPFARAKVGDRYVMEQMQQRGWALGGESSGHIICLDKTTTGDGIVAALQVLCAMQSTGRNLRELVAGMVKLPQKMINVRMKERCDPTQDAQVKMAVEQVEKELGHQGRVLLRLSGTEPVVRVMVEGEDESKINLLVHDLATTVERVLG